MLICPLTHAISCQVVNALLTQLDKLKSAPNVIILTTSNITAAIGRPVIKIKCHMRIVHFSLFIQILLVCWSYILDLCTGQWLENMKVPLLSLQHRSYPHNYYPFFSTSLVSIYWWCLTVHADGLYETSLPHKGRGKVCIHPTLCKLQLWDYTEYVVCVWLNLEFKQQ